MAKDEKNTCLTLNYRDQSENRLFFSSISMTAMRDELNLAVVEQELEESANKEFAAIVRRLRHLFERTVVVV